MCELLTVEAKASRITRKLPANGFEGTSSVAEVLDPADLVEANSPSTSVSKLLVQLDRSFWHAKSLTNRHVELANEEKGRNRELGC
jgi:hypothetical protein